MIDSYENDSILVPGKEQERIGEHRLIEPQICEILIERFLKYPTYGHWLVRRVLIGVNIKFMSN